MVVDGERVDHSIGRKFYPGEETYRQAGKQRVGRFIIACGIDVILTHHPIADAANSGGVPLKSYLDLYDISVMELHEAFHGLHPGLSWLHGHKAFRVEIAYGGIPGNILYVGKALPEVKTLGDMLARLENLMCLEVEKQLLELECKLRGNIEIYETCLATRPEILAGAPENPVGTVAHIFPHTGFTAPHLVQVKKEHPEIDTLLATISRVHRGSDLLKQAEEMGLNFVVGNCHAVEIFENGLPLARAIQLSLPEVEVLMLRERVTATALADFGNEGIRKYADDIARTFLLPNKEKIK
jgi:hypothetical protein